MTSATATRGGEGSGPAVRSLASLGSKPLTELRGIGPKTAAAARKLGLDSIADLLWHVPRRYVDRSTQIPIARLGEVRLGDSEELTVIAEVVHKTSRRIRRNLTLHEITLTDATGHLRASWFNQPGRARLAEEGSTVAVSGQLSFFRGRPKLEVSAIEPIARAGDTTSGVVPVHPAGAGISPAQIRSMLHEALERTGELADPIPRELLERHGLAGRTWAFRQVHFPDDLACARKARTRLVYDELFTLEIALALRKRDAATRDKGLVLDAGGPLWEELLGRLPYELTAAQQRVLAEIAGDLSRPVPMHRLLQGEVGSGKTVVAALTLVAAVDSGFQGALMAPTEVLAEQHHQNLREYLGGLRVANGGPAENLLEIDDRELGLALLTNRTTAKERDRILRELESGRIDVVIGTHALIQEGVRIPRLGVAVIDEQHRFGVHQRVALRDRAEHAGDGGSQPMPDVLIMTATPIPRTLSMTLYGDLDVSLLDELPPGRRPIRTELVPLQGRPRERVYEHLRREVAAGRQAYVICPLVEESEQLAATSATAEYERLQAGELHDLRLGLLHGQLRPGDKQEVMDRFRRGDIDVLVATTVVEVGVDVPNATVMVVEDADRFGLSQLHQLRGRIGRGAAESTCYLVCDPQTPEATARMEAMAQISDGFELANRDLEIRGEGSVFGARQHGLSDLRVARLLRDFEWVERARRDAFALVESDPVLDAHPLLAREIGTRVGDAVDWLQRS